MPPSNVANGSADSCATITARRLEFFVVAWRGRVLHRRAIVSDRFGGVGAWRARRNSAVFLRGWDRGDQQHIVGERREKLRRHDDVKVKRA